MPVSSREVSEATGHEFASLHSSFIKSKDQPSSRLINFENLSPTILLFLILFIIILFLLLSFFTLTHSFFTHTDFIKGLESLIINSHARRHPVPRLCPQVPDNPAQQDSPLNCMRSEPSHGPYELRVLYTLPSVVKNLM